VLLGFRAGLASSGHSTVLVVERCAHLRGDLLSVPDDERIAVEHDRRSYFDGRLLVLFNAVN
jgi:hypothetical protein